MTPLPQDPVDPVDPVDPLACAKSVFHLSETLLFAEDEFFTVRIKTLNTAYFMVSID